MDETMRELERRALGGDVRALESLKMWVQRKPMHELNKGVLGPGTILELEDMRMGNLSFTGSVKNHGKTNMAFYSYGQEHDSWFQFRAVRTERTETPAGCLLIMPKETILAHVASCSNDECMKCGMLTCPVGEPGHYWKDGCPCCSYNNYDHVQHTHPFGPKSPVDASTFIDFDESFHGR